MPQRLKFTLSNLLSLSAMISDRTNGTHIDEFAHPEKHANSDPFLRTFLADISPSFVARIVQQFLLVGVIQFGLVYL